MCYSFNQFYAINSLIIVCVACSKIMKFEFTRCNIRWINFTFQMFLDMSKIKIILIKLLYKKNITQAIIMYSNAQFYNFYKLTNLQINKFTKLQIYKLINFKKC